MDRMQDTENNTLELLCQQSLRQYREMVVLLQSLQGNLQDQSSGSVIQFNVTFAELQNQIQQTDQEVAQQLNLQPDSTYIVAFLNHRKELQEDMFGLIGETVPKADSVKSLLANEMQTLKQGKKALNGYKSQQGQYGRIVNKAF
ncbi:MAG: hypothetical protein GY799_23245 [Desulfobulbaceae bacterium]|nr:hypothetical protein [Desulfobulbaceae bacterium]